MMQQFQDLISINAWRQFSRFFFSRDVAMDSLQPWVHREQYQIFFDNGRLFCFVLSFFLFQRLFFSLQTLLFPLQWLYFTKSHQLIIIGIFSLLGFFQFSIRSFDFFRRGSDPIFLLCFLRKKIGVVR